MNSTKTKKIILFILLLLLFFPLIQFSIVFFEEDSLNGSFTLKPKPDTSFSWFTNDYQKQYEEYFNDHLGFRNYLIRVNNQIRFSFLNSKLNVIRGDNNILFDEKYINSMLGSDFIGSFRIKEIVKDVNTVSEYLRKDNKQLLIVLSPNKARYFKNEIPKEYKLVDTSNYEILVNNFKNSNINVIDFNNFFLTKKKEVSYNLIPKYGIHWSSYGAFLCADSIIKYCNYKFGYNLPEYIVNSIEYTKIPRNVDYDLASSLNLIFQQNDENYLYPVKSISENKNSQKKKLLVIGDSFFDVLYNEGFTDDIFNLTGFWYYNNLDRQNNNIWRSKELFNKKIKESDLIMIVITEWNLYRFGFGIIEELKALYENKPCETRDLILIKNQIRRNKEWFANVEKQAKERNISVDSMLVRSALWYSRNKKNLNN